MPLSEFSPLEIEELALRFLAVILDKKHSEPPVVPFRDGVAVFSGLDIVQERGRLPLLKLEFHCGPGLLYISFYSYISPFKICRASLSLEGNPPTEHVFAEPGKLYLSETAMSGDIRFPTGVSAERLIAGLYLWRSCVGLADICADDLKKYFSKMKSVSHHEWELESYSKNDDVACEIWSARVCESAGENVRVSVSLQNGIVSRVAW